MQRAIDKGQVVPTGPLSEHMSTVAELFFGGLPERGKHGILEFGADVGYVPHLSGE